jgi:predicted nucleic acid-binding protein
MRAKAATVFIDTNVLVYAADDHDLLKRDRARQWLAACWARYCGRLSTQVLNEYYTVIRRKFPTALAAGDAREQIRRLQAWQPWQVDHQTIESAWAIEARQQLHYWDALMVAAAQHMGCTLLLTEDLQHDQRIDTLRIVNPFLAEPSLLDDTP